MPNDIFSTYWTGSSRHLTHLQTLPHFSSPFCGKEPRVECRFSLHIKKQKPTDRKQLSKCTATDPVLIINVNPAAWRPVDN